MAEHIGFARNLREFLTDCYCGMGSLAFASMMAEPQARAGRYNPLAPKPPHMPAHAKAKASIVLYMADGPLAQEPGVPMYQHGFLPAVYQPTFMRPGSKPVLNLDLPKGVSLDERRKTIDLIRGLNEANRADEDPEFAARISAYDTAFKMQTEAPEVFDITKESRETLELYGVGDPKTDDYGRRCLLARRR